MSRQLTPYDRGERLEPSLWVTKEHGKWIAGEEKPRPATDDDFGRVDFTDDENSTIVGVHVTNVDGVISVIVDVVSDVLPIVVEVHE